MEVQVFKHQVIPHLPEQDIEAGAAVVRGGVGRNPLWINHLRDLCGYGAGRRWKAGFCLTVNCIHLQCRLMARTRTPPILARWRVQRHHQQAFPQAWCMSMMEITGGKKLAQARPAMPFQKRLLMMVKARLLSEVREPARKT